MDEYEDVNEGTEEEAMVIDIDTTDAIQFGHVDTGEYRLQCIRVTKKEGTNDKGPWTGYVLAFDIPDEIAANEVSRMEFYPKMDGTPKQNEKTKSNLSKFKDAFGIAQSDSFRYEDLVGSEVWAYLTVKDDPTYGLQNRIRNWIVSQG